MIEPRPPEPAIEPLDDYVVIQPSDEETETRAWLDTTASAENSCRSGVVTAVGNDADSIEPGDKVLFPKSPATRCGSPARRSESFAAAS